MSAVLFVSGPGCSAKVHDIFVGVAFDITIKGNNIKVCTLQMATCAYLDAFTNKRNPTPANY